MVENEVGLNLSSVDYESVGLRVGLEIHQQLDTEHKLFCNCPTELAGEDVPASVITRYLRVAKSEIGEIDPAALYEMRKGRRIIYLAPSNHSCMVELDEEPPHDLNREAVKIALAIALALHSKPVDEIYVMRKIVIDGSNTTGFQRTAIIATDGFIEDDEGRVGIQTICVEEDAARKVGEGPGYVKYNLDRLGIPLIEIATSPDIKSPEQAMRVAFKIGLLMRLTGKVKRGLGTVRQDLNVSIKGGVKTEIKGVSKLELIPKVIRNEVMRQLTLLKIRDELRRRGVKREWLNYVITEVTDILRNCRSRLIRKSLSRGLKVFASPLKGFKGLLKVEVQEGRRFGTELADYARAWGGVGGLIHSDELPGYGIDEEVKRRIYERLGIDPERDAFVLVIGDDERARRALRAVIDRAREAINGIPRETRGANPDGTTRYLRPQPGAARMYPETDVPPLRISKELLSEAEKLKPRQPDELLKEIIEEHGVSEELAKQLIKDPALFTYLDLVKDLRGLIHPQLIASTLLITIKGLKSEGIDVSGLSIDSIRETLKAVGKGLIAKEAVHDVLAEHLSSGKPVNEILAKYRVLSEDELTRIVDKVLRENIDEVRRRGGKAFGLIMGRVMSVVRGRVDGRTVAKIVRERLENLKELQSPS